ncbi:MAG: TIM barrel protein [Thermoplasmatota archaeon]
MTIRFGPAGIPLSCKGRTLKDGIEDIHALQLDAMEVQLLRPLRDIPEELDLIKELGEELDVKLSVHAPYYMDLLGDENYVRRSLDNVLWSGEVARELGADIVAIHVGMYHGYGYDEALEIAVKKVRWLRDKYKKMKLDIKLAVETSGRQKVFGSLDEILAINKRVKNTIPLLNIPNLHARGGGTLRDKEDFQQLFDRVKETTGSTDFYIHFSGVEHADGDKIMGTPIKKGDLRFDPMAEMMLANPEMNFRIISESPLLEHDAVYMKLILDRILQRKIQKEERQKEKAKSQ